jgi:hypothetical protein
MDVAHGGIAEKQLDILIERRARKGEVDPDEESDLWRQSVRGYEEKRRQMARLEWHAFHCGQAERHRRTLEELVSYHEAAAAQLREAGSSNAWP